MKGNVYTLGFAAGLGIICSLLLTAVADFTKDYQDANREAEETINVLKVLGVEFDEDASSEELIEIRDKNVKMVETDGQVTYEYRESGSNELKSVAMQFAGPGLWGPVKGLLALEADRKTISGITFYEQEETPGLGGDIAADWFCERFLGKTIYGADGKAGIDVAMPGTEVAANRIDGITGATMTCDKVESMLNTAIETFVKEN